MNSKSARKKLVKALFNVPRQALDLLPMYARLVAILDKVCMCVCTSQKQSYVRACFETRHPQVGCCRVGRTPPLKVYLELCGLEVVDVGLGGGGGGAAALVWGFVLCPVWSGFFSLALRIYSPFLTLPVQATCSL